MKGILIKKMYQHQVSIDSKFDNNTKKKNLVYKSTS